ALNLLPTRFAAVVLILASFVLFALEAKFATHGVLAMGGITTLVIGSLLLVDAPIPEMRVKLATALGGSSPLGIMTVYLMAVVRGATTGAGRSKWALSICSTLTSRLKPLREVQGGSVFRRNCGSSPDRNSLSAEFDQDSRGV